MRKKWLTGAITLIVFPLLITGCMFGPDQEGSAPIDPPPKKSDLPEKSKPDPSGMTNQKKSTTQAAKKNELELYFMTDSGYIAPYALNVPKVEGIAKEAVKYMVKDGPGEATLPKGFSGILPKNTQVKGLSIRDGIATVNFSKEFLSYDKGMEEDILAALTWTLTGFDSVKKVNIKVDGKALKEMPKGKSVAQNLSRASGINVELAQGIDAAHSMPVTLYFLGQTPNNEIYYVPVTRMINRRSNVAEATLKELVKGPQTGSDLVTALGETTKVNGVKVQGDTAIADFGKQLLQYSDKHEASKDALKTIILSLTENSAVKKVKITVDGKSDALSGDDSYEKPVNRPEKVNPGGF
ncbi:germination protein M [Marininema mesophilum]|uniref:Germination protein M n=1 Tax=Marininema mesophilum TaxID=1048340 RepID=A0A1H2RX89_9BACL|nr:GerMN domain-containing protein [Marininema mesophilum]SDW24091.1 germination protein M [Marininema mesophilum]